MERGVNLKKVTIGNDVKKINERAFFFSDVDVIIIEEGVEEIGDGCFSDCYLKEIYFPASVKKLGEVIMQTEEGLDGTIIHCVEDSAAAQYFEKDMPYGYAELKYEAQKNE